MDEQRTRIVLLELLHALRENRSRAYVQDAHIRHINTRFRCFDERLVCASPESLYGFIRLYPDEFISLHSRLYRRLAHSRTHRAPISTKERLCVFLRFVAHGPSFSHLSGEFSIGISTVSTVTYEVSDAINKELHDSAFPNPTPQTWRTILKDFGEHWDYPTAIGALDGKHVSCVCPARSGTRYHNYKGFFSIVLLALVDAKYKCVLYDLGASGSNPDSGIFLESPIKDFVENHDADFPEPVHLDTIGNVPTHILVDQGFRMSSRFIRPYSQKDADENRRSAYFNARLSRARRVVENYFGILASRFRVLLRPIYAQPSHVKSLALSIMILHNLMIDNIGPTAAVERYGISTFFQNEGRSSPVGNIPNDAKLIRDMMRSFFARSAGIR